MYMLINKAGADDDAIMISLGPQGRYVKDNERISVRQFTSDLSSAKSSAGILAFHTHHSHHRRQAEVPAWPHHAMPRPARE